MPILGFLLDCLPVDDPRTAAQGQGGDPEPSSVHTRFAVLQALEESKKAVYVFPEVGITNGVALLGLQPFAFSLAGRAAAGTSAVQPCTLRLASCLPPPSLLRSGGVAVAYARQLFAPYTKFDFDFLPPMAHEAGENPVVFAKRVQRAMAEDLQCGATDYMYSAVGPLGRRRGCFARGVVLPLPRCFRRSAQVGGRGGGECPGGSGAAPARP